MFLFETLNLFLWITGSGIRAVQRSFLRLSWITISPHYDSLECMCSSCRLLDAINVIFSVSVGAFWNHLVAPEQFFPIHTF
ncbi:hypothetical protein F4604DRAFT_1698324, partial [Suillus subluteus]